IAYLFKNKKAAQKGNPKLHEVRRQDAPKQKFQKPATGLPQGAVGPGAINVEQDAAIDLATVLKDAGASVVTEEEMEAEEKKDV
ncbi:unnamed protein product, partial [marine sediment metagenome]